MASSIFYQITYSVIVGYIMKVGGHHNTKISFMTLPVIVGVMYK